MGPALVGPGLMVALGPMAGPWPGQGQSWGLDHSQGPEKSISERAQEGSCVASPEDSLLGELIDNSFGTVISPIRRARPQTGLGSTGSETMGSKQSANRDMVGAITLAMLI